MNRMKYGWDDELKECDLREWREWHKEAKELDEVKIPRALLLIFWGEGRMPYPPPPKKKKNITTRNNIRIKAFFATFVYSIF